MLGKCDGISENDQFHTGTGDRYVHAPQVVQEAYLSILVGPYQTDQDDIAFLPLETVNGVYGDQSA